MTDRFASLLRDLGQILGIPLSPDRYHACSIEVFPLTVQLELDPIGENLFLFAKIIEIPPGKFRENVLGEALKTNGLEDPRIAVFGYVAKTNHLAIHQIYPMSALDGESLSGIFGAFFDLGESWYNAIQNGRTSPPQALGGSRR